MSFAKLSNVAGIEFWIQRSGEPLFPERFSSQPQEGVVSEGEGVTRVQLLMSYKYFMDIVGMR